MTLREDNIYPEISTNQSTCKDAYCMPVIQMSLKCHILNAIPFPLLQLQGHNR